MSGAIRVLGLDPGFAKIGWAKVELRPDAERVLEMGIIRTEKSAKKRKVRATDDNFERWTDIAETLDDMFAWAQVVTAEGVSFVRNAGTMHQIGGTWGVVATLAKLYDTPVLNVTPQAIKKELCDVANATKEEVQAALDERYGGCLGEAHLGGVARGLWEHPYDALGSIVTARDDETMRALLKGVKAA